MDIETIEFKGTISIKTKNKLEIFIINSNLLTIGPSYGVIQVDQAIDDLWNKFFDFILLNCDKDVIFVHNLGAFEGFFIYKAMSKE